MSSPHLFSGLDPEPLVTPRANAFGGASRTVAGNVDALYYNPAGIGGMPPEQ